MKCVVLMVVALMALTARGVEEPPQPPAPVSLAVAGDLDAALVERVRMWAAVQLALPVPLDSPLSLDGAPTSLDEVARAAAARLSPESLGVVVLFAGEQPVAHHGIYNPELRVAVVNVRLMAEGADEETFARRLERQVIRGICSLMGLELSPNPESAMAAYSSMEELDQIARNLDPPWLIRLQERALELGIPLDPDSPYNMFRDFTEE